MNGSQIYNPEWHIIILENLARQMISLESLQLQVDYNHQTKNPSLMENISRMAGLKHLKLEFNSFPNCNEPMTFPKEILFSHTLETLDLKLFASSPSIFKWNTFFASLTCEGANFDYVWNCYYLGELFSSFGPSLSKDDTLKSYEIISLR